MAIKGGEKKMSVEEAKKMLTDCAATAKPVTALHIDGEHLVVYACGRGQLDLAESRIAIPFSDLVNVSAQILTRMVVPQLQAGESAAGRAAVKAIADKLAEGQGKN